MNSPRDASSVYPFTPFPVDRTRLAEEPYLQVVKRTKMRREQQKRTWYNLRQPFRFQDEEHLQRYP